VAVYGVRGVLASIRAKVAAEKRLERAEKRGIRAAEKVNRDYRAATSDMANKEAAEKEAAEKRARALADAAAVLVDGGVEPELAAVLAAKLVA
jgi:predicted Holliday junction resolvase-like endonuclease